MEEDAAYRRGRSEGQISERLDGHDRHFATINGQLAAVAQALADLTATVVRVGDKQQAIIDTTAATRDAVRAAADRRWSRWQKMFTVLGALATVATLVGVYIAWHATH